MQDYNIPVAVFDDAITRPISLVAVYTANITDKKETSRLIKQLQELFPLTSLPHIKRVRCHQSRDGGKQLQIIICRADDIQENSSCLTLAKIFSKAPDFNTSGLGKVTSCSVSKYQPRTRAQYEEAQHYWPSAFHEDRELSRMLDGTFFSNSELQRINNFMNTALDIAKKAKSDGATCPIGAVIVNPDSSKIVASCHDLRMGSCNPLFHAVMLCVDLVARSQGGGAWDIHDTPGFYWKKMTSENSESGPSSEGDMEQSCLMGPAQVKIDSDCSSDKRKDGDLNGKVRNLKRKHEEETQSLSNSYLCTGLELYVTREPCIMCAMALVHSRIQRVFYGVTHPDGALGSRYKVHCQPGINHHFQVFKGIFEKECRELGVT